MKHIFRIAVKDYKIQLKSILNYLLVSLVLIVIFSLTGMTQKQTIFAIMSFAVMYGFVNKALYEDERNNTLRLLVSLPVKRDLIVYARYLSTAFFIALFSLLMFLMSGFADLIMHSAYEPETFVTLVITSLFMTIMLAIYMPLAFKLGYIKAAGINRLIFVGIFAFFGAISFALSGAMKGKNSELLQKLDTALSSMSKPLILTFLFILVLIAYLVSMAISVKLFRKRLLF